MRGALLLAVLLWAGPVWAEVTPQAGNGDPHVQAVTYDPDEVVALHVANGFALTVRFGADERIEMVTLGDTSGWVVQANKRGDSLVIKPVGYAPTTNLTVLSDTRVYNFTLYGANPGEGVQPYLLSFTYPGPSVAAPAIVGRYRMGGDKALWPAEIGDDGAMTRMRWSGGGAMPAVYGVGPGGRALVNGVMRDGFYVVEGVFARLTFAQGHARAEARRIMP